MNKKSLRNSKTVFSTVLEFLYRQLHPAYLYRHILCQPLLFFHTADRQSRYKITLQERIQTDNRQHRQDRSCGPH